MSDTETMTSVEQDGRILTGVGVSAEELETTLERHARPGTEPLPQPESDPPAESQQPVTDTPRNEQGQFTKPTRGQKRFDQLTKEREDASRRADAAERERDELKQRLAVTTSPTPSAPAPATPAPEPVREPATAPHSRQKPMEDQVGTTYQTYGEYVEDLADWKAEQRLATMDFDARIRASIEADRASRSRQDTVTQAVTRGRAAFADFDAVLNAPHMTAANWPADKIEAIASVDAPEQVQYALGKDPALAERLRTLDPITFGRELTKLIAPVSVASPASTARTMVATPPAPYQPVAGGGKTTVPSSADLASRGDSDFDRSGYREQRARERGVKIRW